jgi:hypothetical protein
MSIWEIVKSTAEAFQEVFTYQWLGNVGNAKHPFHLFEKCDI